MSEAFYNLITWLVICACEFVLAFILLRNLPKLPALQSMFSSLTPVFLDGLLLVVSSFLTAFLTYLATEEAYKYVWPVALFWLKVFIGSTSSSIQALVAFRNQKYAEHRQRVSQPST